MAFSVLVLCGQKSYLSLCEPTPVQKQRPGREYLEECTHGDTQPCEKDLTCVKMTDWITEKCNPEDVCKEYHEGSGKLQCTMQRNSNSFENGASKYDDRTQPYLGECGR
ncbi:hypothetical protein DYB37_006431 [Aphanomyces astaci]|uniref:Uncharacterized protein n=1 Tax=Aphanomyces astaci TaxID=112090 RepID=A0A418E3N4_APHAT|nr:hypothetical protein DYB37_006431 [Aphanomyces astaci]